MKNRIRLAGGLALLLSPLILVLTFLQGTPLPAEVPQSMKADLEDLAKGPAESDETLSCSVIHDKGSVEFSLGPVPSGLYRWTIRQGTATMDEGILDSGNGWKASQDDVAQGVYTLEVTRPGDDTFKQRIDFAIGLENAKFVKKCENAIGLHGAKDYNGLIKALEKVDVQAATVPPQMREDLAWARIDGLFFYRKFENIFPAIEAFRNQHPASARMVAVMECEMAARFEQGLKKAIEAVRFPNARADERRAEGEADLGRFLSLAASRPAENYTTLSNRDLRQNLWTARVVLGEEQAAEEEIPVGDTADREKFHLLCALLHPKMHPDRADENLQRMKDFLVAYPKSPGCPKVEFDMASVALNEGIRLVSHVGTPVKAAAPYFESARLLFDRVAEDKEAGISVADVWESWDGILRSYYWDRDNAGRKDEAKLMAWSEWMISMSKPGDSPWRQAKLYQGDLLISQRKYDQAAAVLDELVALGFKGNPSHDGRTSFAVKWRIAAAKRMGNEEKARQLRQWVQDSNCEDSIRRGWKK